MNIIEPINILNFFAAGINYKKADAATRGQFAINDGLYDAILQLAPSFHIDSFFILSTCNRTEIYGFADHPDQLINLLCTQTAGAAETFKGMAYVKRGTGAIEHLFNVGAGLDSQILGDYEIIGQLKKAVKFSKDRGLINCFLERLFNCVLQSSKLIKNETALSGGTVSVSFAAVQYIKDYPNISADRNILVIGAGKIGRNTCKNLIACLGTTNITLINRSEEKAAELAAELNLNYAPINELADYIASSAIILVATNSCAPVVLRSDVENKGSKLIVDLSVPNNVEIAVRALPGVTVIDVDTLSKLKDVTLQKRELETPKAREIIAQHQACFMEWYYMRKNAPVLKAIKSKLNEIYNRCQCAYIDDVVSYPLMHTEGQIQRALNRAAYKMRIQNQQGCHYIEAINEFMGTVAS